MAHALSASASAIAELQHLLTIPPETMAAHSRNNPMAVAHAVLESIRDSGDVHFLFLRTILEITATNQHLPKAQEELLFHCITGCRQVVLWRWMEYSNVFQQAMRDFFLLSGHRLSESSRTCQLACYTTSVSFWKRAWMDELSPTDASAAPNANEQSLFSALQQQTNSISNQQLPIFRNRQNFYAYLENSLFSEQYFMQHPTQATGFLDCLIGEFVGKSSVSYRLPLHFHKQAHHSFERETLSLCLKLSIRALQYVINHSSTSLDLTTVDAVVQLASDVLGWEFGITAWDTGSIGASATVKKIWRPPVAWKDSPLGQPEFLKAVLTLHNNVMASNHPQTEQVSHDIRQMIVQLGSMSGPIFINNETRKNYMSTMCEGALHLMQVSSQQQHQIKENESSLLSDTLLLLSRLITNFRLAQMIQIPSLLPLLQGFTAAGSQLLADHLRDCEEAKGDVESMEHYDWTESVLAMLLECAVLLCGDPWLLYSGTEETRKQAQISLSGVLGPLYEGFVHCRTRMAAMEEHYLVSNEGELDEVREEILETDLEEEMSAIATIGRLHLGAAISCLSGAFGKTMPQLRSLWDTDGDVTPEASALLEESRLLTMYVCHLLTDSNDGESPTIPDAVLIACLETESLSGDISAAVQALLMLADSQMQKIAKNPHNRRLSPFLAKTFLWFLNRWAPTYVYPVDYSSSRSFNNNRLVREWSEHEKASQAITFSVTLCLHYQCYWPQEKPVQECASNLLLALAKRGGNVRSLMANAPVFIQLVQFHCITAGIRHSASPKEFEEAARAKIGANAGLLQSMPMISGFHRLPYGDKAQILTAILIACSDTGDEKATAMINDALKAVHDAFSLFVNALSTKQVSHEEVNAREMACLCVEMFCGVVRSSEMSNADRIPQLITSYLPQLSGLMNYYANDLTICEVILRFFRDYTEHFIALLNRDQSLALFNASAEVLRGYSVNHCADRVIRKKTQTEADNEEEQAYNDILCAVQLLINLGTKDFIDSCSASGEGVHSSQVTDMIFFGLQQILPLMTQGLLQFPVLCKQFFDLVSFMVDTYPEKFCVLPYDLFDSVLESLLFAMSHHSADIGKCALQSLGSLAREHLASHALQGHLVHHPHIFDKSCRRLLTEVVFQNVIMDRVEAAGMALLPMAAVDVNRFAAVVQELSAQVPDGQQRDRLNSAFSKLIQPEMLSKASANGYEGRMNRVKFKENFEAFVHEIHSFLVLR